MKVAAGVRAYCSLSTLVNSTLFTFRSPSILLTDESFLPCSVRLFPVPGINPVLQVQIYRIQTCDSCTAIGTLCSNADQLVYFDSSDRDRGIRSDVSRGSGGGRVEGRGVLRYLLNPSLGAESQKLEWELMPTRVTLGEW